MNKAYVLLLTLISMSCSAQEISPGNDPNFTIVSHNDSGFKKTNRKVMVFDIPIYAFKEVPDQKLLHAANVMAQYLDNNQDGLIDNQHLHETLLANDAALFMWKKESQIRIHAQDLGADETVPEWHEDKSQRFDATLEEVWHVITHSGYSKAYPEVFGEYKGTRLAKAMDVARGGQFDKVPSSYPEGAWYSYDDETCDYSCMVTEYFYWGMTSILGGQADRLEQIGHEWRLNTREKVESSDPLLFQLLTDTEYALPSTLPNGKYQPNK